jgi:hypothetical protein
MAHLTVMPMVQRVRFPSARFAIVPTTDVHRDLSVAAAVVRAPTAVFKSRRQKWIRAMRFHSEVRDTCYCPDPLHAGDTAGIDGTLADTRKASPAR